MPDRRGAGVAPDRAGLRASLSAVLSVIRRIAGMPDYPAHLEHLRRCHPERALPSEREFYEEFVRARYADGPTRCC
jgi:uncharacterized short protein YbdD (DUF466 family)